MAYRHGVYVNEMESSQVAPASATAGLQVVVGTAPVHLLEDPEAAVNTPLLVQSLTEATQAVGYSADWVKYTICDAVNASFTMMGVGPLVLINVLDPKKHTTEMPETQVTVKDGQATVEREGLLLAGLNTRFAAARAAGAVTDACYQQLRSFKRTLSQQPDADPADLFAERCDAYRAKLEADKTAGALLPDEAAARTRTLALLTAWSRSLDNGLDADEAFDTVRGAFNTQVQRREEAVSAASNALEFAFDFMEQAFEDGQEMVVFVNELALGPDSAPFLAENDCERFERYSEKLLLHGGEDELLAELQRDDVRAEEHSAEF